jgi:hypothetical protein
MFVNKQLPVRGLRPPATPVSKGSEIQRKVSLTVLRLFRGIVGQVKELSRTPRTLNLVGQSSSHNGARSCRKSRDA